ncbi:MAG: gluconate 2-dehydrogenase subunit 3 family protein [Chitinophagaceae bacterium]|nr:gluconate 2-dehydrogenase subunit 3 family protein [Chitinophagaceae bacterium]
MNRRESLKALGITTISTGVLIEACKPKPEQTEIPVAAKTEDQPDRQPNEIARENKLNAETFFTAHEMATITVLGDIIIPKDARSGSASDAKVPAFIEFTVKDRPEHQIPMRGGIKWLDTRCLNRYNNSFKDCTSAQQIEIIEEIAYPEHAKPDMQHGVSFFDRMRELTAGGFFSSKMGVEDLGYAGNKPNKWEGVPADVIKQYGLENVTFV